MGKWKIPPDGGHMEKPSGVYFQTMTMKQIRERLDKCDLIIIPVGSTENHGDNAPTGEDTFLVTRMAEQVALATGCTVSEPIWFGFHPYHHIGMPGTIPVKDEAFIDQLVSVMAGFWNTGFRKQILLNGHGQEFVIPIAIHKFAKIFQVPAIIINLNWYHAIQDKFKTKEEGGPYETPFIHADEAETSWSLALFPEFIHQEWATSTQPRGYLPEGHIDKAGNLLHRPIAWYGHVGGGPIEVKAYPEGVVGRADLADANKAREGLEALLDYMEKLVVDIMDRFPPWKLPPAEELSCRPKEELEALLKKPFEPGWRPLYAAGNNWL